MATDFTQRYGAPTIINITLDSLANGSYRAGSGIVNTSGFTDMQVSFRITSPAASTDSNGSISFFAAASTNKGAYYTDGVSGQDSAFTPSASATNLFRLGYGPMVANSTTYTYGPFSLASAFDGALPEYVAVVVGNNCGASLPSSAAGSGWYQGVSYRGTP